MQSTIIILSLLLGATVVLSGSSRNNGQRQPGFPSNRGNNTEGSFTREPRGNFTGLPPNGNDTFANGSRPGGFHPIRRQRSIQSRGNETRGPGGRPNGSGNFTGTPPTGNFTRGPHGNFTGFPPNRNNTNGFGGRPGGFPPVRRQRSIQLRGNETRGHGGRPNGPGNFTGFPHNGNFTREPHGNFTGGPHENFTRGPHGNFTGFPPNGNNTNGFGGRPGGFPPVRRQRSIQSRGNEIRGAGGRPIPIGAGNFTGTPPSHDSQEIFGNVTVTPGSDSNRPSNNGNRPGGQRG